MQGKPHIVVLVLMLVLLLMPVLMVVPVRMLLPLLILRAIKVPTLPFSTLLWRNGRMEPEARLRAACCVS